MQNNNELLSELTIHMKYAKFLEDKKRRESYLELVERNKKMHIEKFPELEQDINFAYSFVLNKKVLPSMRSMQFAGKPIQINPVRMFNCSFMAMKDYRAFHELMFLLLSGCGVGISVQKHHVEKLPEIRKPSIKNKRRYVIGDSIVGWSDAIKALFKSYYGVKNVSLEFDYSDIRPEGAKLLTSGGKAPGSKPLKDCLDKIRSILDSKVDGDKLSTIDVYDISCHIADSVLAGGIRRAALLTLFTWSDEDMLHSKSGDWYKDNPQRARSNNSVALVRSRLSRDLFFNIWDKIQKSGCGEPAFSLTNNAEMGFNPCITGNTIVAIADGRNGVTVEQLAKESEGKIKFPVYSAKPYHTSNQFGKTDKFIKWVTEIKDAVAFKTGTKNVIKLILSDDSVLEVTPDHKLALMNGKYIEAKDSLNKTLGKFYSYSNKNDAKSYRKINSKIVEHLRPEDKNVDLSEEIYVKQIIDEGKCVDVYDLTVEDNHNFYLITKTDDNRFLNSSGILVHNCHEISLRDMQFCNLTEINVSDVTDQKDFEDRVRAATLIGTLQATYTDFHYLRREWKLNTEKDALLGVSMTGVASMSIFNLDIESAAKVAVEVNRDISKFLKIKPAKRITTLKPAGTTSLVLGCSSGVHAWHDKFYIRRIRINKNEAIYTYLSLYYPELMEDDISSPEKTSIISIPQRAPIGSAIRDESALDLLNRVKELTLKWIRPGHIDGYNHHNVSCTVSIKEDEWNEVGNWMWENRDCYSGISVLPYNNHTYKQAPFESCSEETYNRLSELFRKVDLSLVYETDDSTNFNDQAACSGGACEIK